MINAKRDLPKILVVDDLVENAKLIENLLRPKGFDLTSAYSGREALQRVEESPPDVILLDLVMPEMDGFEVCQILKQNPNTHHIPIIIVTGMTEREANIQAIEAGADDFLRKPFDSQLLEARIRSSVKSKMLQDKIFEYQRELEMHNENLENVVKERTTQVLRTQQVTVFSLAKLAESRDTDTGEHLERMRCYAREVAHELVQAGTCSSTLDEGFAERIFESSPLHDIGKVGIPDRILLKPGRLTKDEFKIMKTHTVIGGDTLKAADAEAGTNSFLAMGCDIAYLHHEKWDGSGYPRGLKGPEIPISSRIVAVGDVYDALTSKRPYKEPFSHEKSMGIIIEGRGSHFDPAVVDAFVAREEAIVTTRQKFQDSGQTSPIQKLTEALDRLDSTEGPAN